MPQPIVQRAAIYQRAQAIATLQIGFAADPLMRWLWPDPEAYLERTEFFDALCGDAVDAGSAFIAGEFAGAALWMPPNLSADEERLVAMLLESIDAKIAEDALSLFGQLDHFHPEGDHWYLPMIAVDPLHQGAGYGSALMKEALRQVDADGLPAYLESSNPRNVSLYERHGFEAIEELRIGSAPLVTPMVRQARC